MSPLHQIAIPNMGLPLGEMWDLEELSEDCAADGVYEFLLVAAPLPVTGAVGAPSTRSRSSEYGIDEHQPFLRHPPPPR